MSDFQEITYRLQEMERKDSIYDDNVHHTPKDYANYLGKINK